MAQFFSMRTLFVVAAFSLGTAATAATIDSFDIDTSDPDGTTSSASLTLGTQYIINVTGTFEIDSGRFADAEYFDFQTPGVRDTSLDLFGNIFDIGVQINDQDIDWGPYSEDHSYSYVTDALEGQINLRLAEVSPLAYLDNSGLLSVVISTANGTGPTPPTVAPVPLPAGLPLLLAGLGGFALLRQRATRS